MISQINGVSNRLFGSLLLLLTGRVPKIHPNQAFCVPVDYPPPQDRQPRWGQGALVHGALDRRISANRESYSLFLQRMLDYKSQLWEIPVIGDRGSFEPCWFSNGLMPALDAAALYTFIAQLKPARYVEVGSGYSTRFVRRSIDRNSPGTRLISLDPQPRVEIAAICDEVIREPIEEIPLSFFDQLEANDILFYDGTHRCFMNNDVVTMFIDVLPRLKTGALVQIHDIFWPEDYPSNLGGFDPSCPYIGYYNEQYLLAAYLLGGGNGVDILLPNHWIDLNLELKSILDPIWEPFDQRAPSPGMPGIEIWGSSFWMRKT